MLLKSENLCVVIFNMQLELIPLLHEGTQLLNDCCWLVDVAETLGVPALIIEHKKLGASSQALKDVAGGVPYLEKIYFDFLRHDHIARAVEDTGRQQFVLAGAEAHVCVLQSALGLRELGKEVFVLSDATSARNLVDHRQALGECAIAVCNLSPRRCFSSNASASRSIRTT
jgi:hypothetical protein